MKGIKMFGLTKKTEETVAVLEPAVEKKEILTLHDVVDQYVTDNDGSSLDQDFTNIDVSIQKNNKVIEFLTTEKRKGFSNSNHIYEKEISKLKDENKDASTEKFSIQQQIEAEKLGLQRIDLSFLSMKKPSKSKIKFQPIFSAHKLEGEKFQRCQFNLNGSEIQMPKENTVSSGAVCFPMLKIFVNGEIDKKCFYEYSYSQEIRYYRGDIISTSGSSRGLQLSSDFFGIVPETTREKINKVKRLFSGRENLGIFLIKECPKWNVQEVTTDPLIVGVIGHKAYLIDHFDCTDIEAWVKQEFTE